ncbi:MAG: rRNA maturation RNase YbeY [bacterium]
MIVLEINNLAKARFNKKYLIKVAQRTGARLKLKGKRLVSLALVGTIASQKLNRQYRRLDRPTDVLSFRASASGRIKSEYLGEIIICYPLAQTQARDYKISVQSELERLLIHGLRHLTGHHHY